MKLIALRNFRGKMEVLSKTEIKDIRIELGQRTAESFQKFAHARTLSWHKTKNKILD
ncbi:MAG: hypothetical protein US83_C0011G0005 [Candidatus Falkowbacteria bacterium GW2011_GWC2_38_22]|uniref:Uncharacterized protein n=1 Tax=Candidatus Falkowbacteria bacterium GW2011_GWE1_38_31 TaxID=1618638 RepID=A0A0G0JT27_9BACT|nr:MAG: hypothetical protein US73_C0009G0005 [Candidatus Falkowbacteria bacterium GW2011_GWF2_38_1205]KKQ60887.1 MAG: hypothetical protein US83_C0011G0005 [Candidatus Falkowbacteria bacterium GW2011_GWC2_38_22]KKQ63005.1 MAG: hypothetical protein US84_C0009G0005 [Candidatus Falkowbacteria bacterium GW2011_GWF1_38_22]KKQ65027.1 MAG: hypothetical protein US87_C0009G0005 [Candidatus Falkowbacteria bacterium GW2011_GWE2_38_254]KKQ69802.1 MAG: hypothetical protein US91_C0009G0005 [Candidatus Falkowb